MKKVLLSCAVAAAVCLSFNVNAMHDANHASSSGVGHAVTNSGATKHAATSTGASFSTTVKTDAKKVYTGAKEYGHKAYDATKKTAKTDAKKVVAGAKEYSHKAYDATKKTAKSAYDSGKHMLSSGHKVSSGTKAVPAKVAPAKAAPAKADSSAKPSAWEKFKGGVSKAYSGTKNTVTGWFSKDNKKDDTSIDAKKS